MNASVFIGEPLIFKKDIKIYPPKVKDVVANPQYGKYVSLFTTSQEDIWDMMAEKEGDIPEKAYTPFELLLINCHHSPAVRILAEESLHFFTHESVRVMPESKLILFTEGLQDVKEIDNLRFIDEDIFFDFQNCLRMAMGEKLKEKPVVDENPRVAIIKAKGRRRDRIVKKKGSASSISTSTMLVAICCMELGITPLNIGEIPYPAIPALFSMAQDKEKHRIDMQLIAGGADAKKVKPKYWIRNIE